jgi:hypothetical protein
MHVQNAVCILQIVPGLVCYHLRSRYSNLSGQDDSCQITRMLLLSVQVFP